MLTNRKGPNEIQNDLFGQRLPQLDIQQTSEGRSQWDKHQARKTAADEARLEKWHRQWAGTCYHANASETAFRHRGWMADRAKVREALVRTQAPANRLERFDHCGAACRVEVATDGSGVRVKASYCGDRWCVPCCTARSVRVVRNVVRLAEGRRLYHTVLTSRPAATDFASCLAHVLESFKRLRDTREWKAAARGGCFTVEVTRGERGDHWHVHIHCLYDGRYLSKFTLRDLWHRASKGSFIVHIGRTKDQEKQVRYVAKYAAKGWARDVLGEPDHTDECMMALRGRRLISTFGSWYNADLEQEPADDREYREVGRLSDIMASAAAGEAWAVGIMTSLGVEVDRVEQIRALPWHPPDSSGT